MSVQAATVKERLISFRSLASVHCPCGETKRARQSFCGRHWHALPGHLQSGLFRADGYADVWLWLFMVLAIVLAIPAITIFRAYQESRTYNRLTGAHTTTWDAIWVELRVQDEPKSTDKL